MIEAPYCAAAVDFDGSITASSKDLNPRVYVSNLHRGVLEELQAAFGGNIGENNHAKKGIIWNWCISGKKVLEFLEYARPYIRIKGQQADVAIALAKTLQLNGDKLSNETIVYRARLCELIHNLNKRKRS